MKIVAFLLIYLFAASAFAQTESKTPSNPYYYSDSTSIWKGFTRYHLKFHGKAAFITTPNRPFTENHWVWRARFPEWHTEMDEILLNEGFCIVYINTDNQFGSPKAMEVWDAFYDYLVKELGFNEKLSLEGVSRGGLFVYNWAKRHPHRVNCIYTEAPVCDFKSWPGGFGNGKGDKKSWEILKSEYGFQDDHEAKAYTGNPIDNLEALAIAKVPVLSMIGLNDIVVPPSENTFILSDRYVKLGGISMIVPCTQGKQDLYGHHFPIESPQLAADFIMLNTPSPVLPLQSSSYHTDGASLKNSCANFKLNHKGTVAFLGGSITWNNGWRDSICNYLQVQFPETKFNFINAGISSMGSTPGAFRLDRDILSKGKIDLLFVEAAVNDATNGRTSKEQIRGMEGILRHTLKDNPATDIVVMHFVDPDKMESYNRGEVPEVIKNFSLVAKHYNVGTINLAKEVTDRINNGEFTWQGDFKNLHPSPFGQTVYFHSMKTFLDQAINKPLTNDEKITPHPLPTPYDPFCYSEGQIISFEKASKLVGFEKVSLWIPSIQAGTREGYVNVDMLVGDKPGDSFEFTFEGTAVGIMVAAGPDAGMIEYTIDGNDSVKVDLFTRWSARLYLPWYKTLAAELNNGAHVLNVKISKDKNPESLGHGCILKGFYINVPDSP